MNFRRFLAAARKKLWWMTPEWGCEPEDLPPETQFLLLELAEGGPYAILLPLIDSDTFRGTLRPPRCTVFLEFSSQLIDSCCQKLLAIGSVSGSETGQHLFKESTLQLRRVHTYSQTLQFSCWCASGNSPRSGSP